VVFSNYFLNQLKKKKKKKQFNCNAKKANSKTGCKKSNVKFAMHRTKKNDNKT
jgi:hypothetical protein